MYASPQKTLSGIGQRVSPAAEVKQLEAVVRDLASKLHSLRTAAESEIERLENEVRELKRKLQEQQQAADTREMELRLAATRRPPPPPPAPPDRTPEFLAIISKMADRKTPTGVKRTPDGMQLVFDEDSAKGTQP